MKIYSSVFYAVLLILLFNTSAFAAERAVNISIGSDGSGNVSSTIPTVRQIIGHAVGSGVVDKFIVDNSSTPIEGGLIACAEAGSSVTDSTSEGDPGLPGSIGEFEQLINQLRSIQPSSGVFLNVETAEACNNDSNPGDIEPGVCTQDAKECPDGSFVSRQPPSCAFAPCPVEE